MLYDWPTWLFAVGLLCALLAANELGFRLGRRGHEQESESSRTASGALKGSIYALVALLLGFSFSATTARYDLRQRVILDQANAVGTCHLRAGLLDEPFRDRTRELLRRYVRARLEYAAAGEDHARLSRAGAEIDRHLADIWAVVEESNRRNPDAVRNSLIVPAANEVIDLSSTRAWANRNHLPGAVLVLLLASVLVTGLLLGHSSGQAGRRHATLWLASNLLFSLVLFVVLDFDRPRRGLIRVDLTPLVELESTLGEAPVPPSAGDRVSTPHSARCLVGGAMAMSFSRLQGE